MRSRVEIYKNGKLVHDQVWKDRKAFVDMSTRGFFADSIRLDVEVKSVEDLQYLAKWCKMAEISMVVKT